MAKYKATIPIGAKSKASKSRKKKEQRKKREKKRTAASEQGYPVAIFGKISVRKTI